MKSFNIILFLCFIAFSVHAQTVEIVKDTDSTYRIATTTTALNGSYTVAYSLPYSSEELEDKLKSLYSGEIRKEMYKFHNKQYSKSTIRDLYLEYYPDQYKTFLKEEGRKLSGNYELQGWGNKKTVTITEEGDIKIKGLRKVKLQIITADKIIIEIGNAYLEFYRVGYDYFAYYGGKKRILKSKNPRFRFKFSNKGYGTTTTEEMRLFRN